MTNPLSAVMGAAKFFSPAIVPKLLGKLDPRFNNYFSRAASYGFGVDQALNYLTDKFKSQSDKDYESQLNSGNLRPDEMASQSRMQNRAIPGKALQTGVSLAAGGLLGREEEQPQQTQSQPMEQQQQQSQQSPLGREGLQEQAAAMVDPQQLLQAFFQMINQGVDPQTASGKLSSMPQYRQVMQDIEQQSKMPFSKWAMGQLQGQGQQPGQGMWNKQSFMQGLNELSQMLQGLKK